MAIGMINRKYIANPITFPTAVFFFLSDKLKNGNINIKNKKKYPFPKKVYFCFLTYSIRTRLYKIAYESNITTSCIAPIV